MLCVRSVATQQCVVATVAASLESKAGAAGGGRRAARCTRQDSRDVLSLRSSQHPGVPASGVLGRPLALPAGSPKQ